MHTDVYTAEYRKQKRIACSWRQCSWIRAVRHANTDLPEQTQSWTELKMCCKPCMQHDVKPTSIRNLTANSCFRSSVPITILLIISCSWEGVNDHRQSSRIFWCLIRTRRSNQNVDLVQAHIDNENCWTPWLIYQTVFVYPPPVLRRGTSCPKVKQQSKVLLMVKKQSTAWNNTQTAKSSTGQNQKEEVSSCSNEDAVQKHGTVQSEYGQGSIEEAWNFMWWPQPWQVFLVLQCCLPLESPIPLELREQACPTRLKVVVDNSRWIVSHSDPVLLGSDAKLHILKRSSRKRWVKQEIHTSNTDGQVAGASIQHWPVFQHPPIECAKHFMVQANSSGWGVC